MKQQCMLCDSCSRATIEKRYCWQTNRMPSMPSTERPPFTTSLDCAHPLHRRCATYTKGTQLCSWMANQLCRGKEQCRGNPGNGVLRDSNAVPNQKVQNQGTTWRSMVCGWRYGAKKTARSKTMVDRVNEEGLKWVLPQYHKNIARGKGKLPRGGCPCVQENGSDDNQ